MNTFVRALFIGLLIGWTTNSQGQDSLTYYKARARMAEDRVRRAELEAKSERYIAVAGEVARLSHEIPDHELATLLALQAYHFIEAYGNRSEDPTIYAALLKAMSNHESLPGKWGSAFTQPIIYVDPSGKSVVTRDVSGNIARWREVDGTWQSATIANVGIKSKLLGMAMLPDGNQVMVAYRKQGKIRLSIFSVADQGKHAVSLVLPSPDLKVMVVSGARSAVWLLGDSGHRIWYSDFLGLHEVVKSSAQMSHLAISQDGKYMAAIEAGNRVVLCDYTKQVISTSGHDELTALTLSPDSRRIILGDKNGTIYVLTINTAIPMRKLYGHKGSVDKIRFNHAGTGLATYGGDKQLLIWDWTRIHVRPLVIPNAASNSILEFSSDDKGIITDGGKFWSVGSDALARELCSRVTRNLSKDEWDTYFSGLKYERTCDAHPANYK